MQDEILILTSVVILLIDLYGFEFIYIHLYYRYIRSEIQKWCTCQYLGTISVRTYRYFHLIHFCDVQQFS